MVARIYLDNLTTTPLSAAAREAMQPFLAEEFGAAQHLYHEGARAGKAVARAREQVASLVGARRVDEIIFTGSGSEAGNFAIKGAAFAAADGGRRHLVSSSAEHPATERSLRFLEQLGWRVTRVGVDATGLVKVSEVQAALRDDTLLVATHLSNHDSGAVQPVAELARLAHGRGALVFCDAMTAGGWVSVSVEQLGVDLLSLSPHRFFGPKGVGVLYQNAALTLEPLIHGGRQEDGRRAGTQNVAAIAGAGVAAEAAGRDLPARAEKCRGLTKLLWRKIHEKIPRVKLNGPPAGADRDPRHLNLSFAEVDAEALMLRLDLDGVSVSANTGCAARNGKLSPVLLAMGVTPSLAAGSILLSPSPVQTEAEMSLAAEKIIRAVAKIRAL
ncbi:MAG: cysteine desulfurase [Verrucomicrobiales bacterium]|jgi:cysteine desulfurase|nr:cysteine desulfurase [Verrucomicrobiales bacterium]